MKSVFICLLLLLAFITNVAGQQLIARQHGGAPTFYTDLNQAITEASGGDTLYLPGEAFSLDVPIDKELHFVGTGHHPDSSRVSGITYIYNSLHLRKGSQKSSFEGLYFNESITVFDTTLTNVNFKRCNIKRMDSMFPMPTYTYMYSSFAENVFRDIIYCNMSKCTFSNCIFQTCNYLNWVNCTFKNNVFLVNEWTWYPNLSAASFCRFENNIFLCNTVNFGPIALCTFHNNIFVYPTSYYDGINNIGSNNILGQTQESIFKNQSGNTFYYSHDYSLNSSSPGIKKGTDGTDIGIYGGPSPWKEGSVPFNPHIQAKTISGYTNADGTLNVQIKVSAQDR